MGKEQSDKFKGLLDSVLEDINKIAYDARDLCDEFIEGQKKSEMDDPNECEHEPVYSLYFKNSTPEGIHATCKSCGLLLDLHNFATLKGSQEYLESVFGLLRDLVTDIDY